MTSITVKPRPVGLRKVRKPNRPKLGRVRRNRRKQPRIDTDLLLQELALLSKIQDPPRKRRYPQTLAISFLTGYSLAIAAKLYNLIRN
ncbi:hypothetical protein KL938_001787 [Ogataea parapolymorpha]|nr:hypothetical protein KL938_001787 [Ogataea parapolymorpha]